jgi:hypothetical protein
MDGGLAFLRILPVFSTVPVSGRGRAFGAIAPRRCRMARGSGWLVTLANVCLSGGATPAKAASLPRESQEVFGTGTTIIAALAAATLMHMPGAGVVSRECQCCRQGLRTHSSTGTVRRSSLRPAARSEARCTFVALAGGRLGALAVRDRDCDLVTCCRAFPRDRRANLTSQRFNDSRA